jgi:hypothetical protein
VTVYDELAELAEREAELIAEGDWVEVVGLEAERRALAEQLPVEPPAEAREALERAQRQLGRNAGAIAASLAATRGELEAIARRRSALGSYAAAPAPRVELKA